MTNPLLRRRVELILFFVVAPGLISLGPRWWVLPAILGGGAVSLFLLLRDLTYPGPLLELGELRRGLQPLAIRTFGVWTGILLLALIQRGPDGLFLFPRDRPVLWVMVLVLYPPFSALPQELMYRAFFFHRYRQLFRSPTTMIAVNAVLFGWGHIIVHNLTAMLLTTVGGLLLAWTFHRTRSTVLVATEHALYGDFVLSIGIGGMFTDGVRLLAKVVG